MNNQVFATAQEGSNYQEMMHPYLANAKPVVDDEGRQTLQIRQPIINQEQFTEWDDWTSSDNSPQIPLSATDCQRTGGGYVRSAPCSSRTHSNYWSSIMTSTLSAWTGRSRCGVTSVGSSMKWKYGICCNTGVTAANNFERAGPENGDDHPHERTYQSQRARPLRQPLLLARRIPQTHQQSPNSLLYCSRRAWWQPTFRSTQGRLFRSRSYHAAAVTHQRYELSL